MSLTLQDIYESTKNKYHLNLITPLHTLKKVMNWVYVGEDITTFDYLTGGELVISTGLCIHNSQELLEFIRSLIQHNCCGLILNIGEYIKISHITSDIRHLCVKNDFALFTMPWEISFQTITRDYYNRIFKDNQEKNSLSEYFLSILRQDKEYDRSITLLDENGFQPDNSYCICVLNYHSNIQEADIISKTEEWKKQLLYSLDSILYPVSIRHHIMIYKDTFVFIYCDADLDAIHQTMNAISEKLTIIRPRFECRIGIGSHVTSLTNLSTSYKRAVAALSFSEYHKTRLYTFEDMGFFRLLLSVHDSSLLTDYLDEQLGTLIAYDKQHRSNYVETLHQYILYNGSIQAIAAAMFCHRNTVNYRVKHLKEMLGYNLDDVKVRFNLMTAFCIKEYLDIL